MNTKQCKTLHIGLSLLCMLFVLTGCKSEEGSAPVLRVNVVGSSTIAPLLSELGKAYERNHPGSRIDVQSGGSSRGIMDVRAGSATIGMVSRKLKNDEQDLQHSLIARDGIGMIVNSNNLVTSLTRDEVVDIYTGQISNWREVGGLDLPITVVSKAEGRSTLEVFSDYFGVPYKDIRAHVIIGDNQQGIQTVAGSAAAIGYVSIGSAEYEAERGASIRLIPLDNQMPTSAAVASGEYKISRELNLVYKEPISEQVRDFLMFTRSSDAAALISQMYFIPAAE